MRTRFISQSRRNIQSSQPIEYDKINSNTLNMKRVIGFALLLSVVANLALLYRILDTGVSLTHQADEIGYKSRQLADMEKIWPVLMPRISQTELMDAARKTGLEVMEKKSENSLVIGHVQFLLSDNRVVAIKFE